jgi:hypothetical protein
MIQLQCTNCRSKLAVQDIYAGKVATCPKCQSKVHIPIPDVEPAEETPDERISAAARAQSRARPSRPRRRMEEEEEEDERPSRPSRRRRVADDDERSEHITEDEPRARPRRRRLDYDEDQEEDEPRPRRRKRRRRRRRPEPEGWSISDVDWGKWILISLGVVALLGFASVAAAFAFPPFLIIPLGLGGLLMFVGYVWFIVVAFQDDVVQGLLCLFLGIYRLYYLIINFDEVKIPFFVELVGLILFIAGICAGGGLGHKN